MAGHRQECSFCLTYKPLPWSIPWNSSWHGKLAGSSAEHLTFCQITWPPRTMPLRPAQLVPAVKTCSSGRNAHMLQSRFAAVTGKLACCRVRGWVPEQNGQQS